MNTEQLRDLDDVRLWQQCCQQGGSLCLGILLERHARVLANVAWRVTKNENDADDAVQMAAAIFTERAHEQHEVQNVRSWMIGVVVNCSRSLIRREVGIRQRHSQAHELHMQERENREFAVEEEQEKQELLTAIDSSLMDLPQNYREAITLHYIEGMSYKEVSEALGRSEENVKKQAQRGIKKLRELLAVRGKEITSAILILSLGQLSAHEVPTLSSVMSISTEMQQGHYTAMEFNVEPSISFSAGTVVTASAIAALLVTGAAFYLAGLSEKNEGSASESQQAQLIERVENKKGSLSEAFDERGKGLDTTEFFLPEAEWFPAQEGHLYINLGVKDVGVNGEEKIIGRFIPLKPFSEKDEQQWLVHASMEEPIRALNFSSNMDYTEFQFRFDFKTSQALEKDVLLILGQLSFVNKGPGEVPERFISRNIKKSWKISQPENIWRRAEIRMWREDHDDKRVWRSRVLVDGELINDLEYTCELDAMVSPNLLTIKNGQSELRNVECYIIPEGSG